MWCRPDSSLAAYLATIMVLDYTYVSRRFIHLFFLRLQRSRLRRPPPCIILTTSLTNLFDIAPPSSSYTHYWSIIIIVALQQYSVDAFPMYIEYPSIKHVYPTYE